MLLVDRLLADSSYCSYDSMKVIRFMPQNNDHVNVLKKLVFEVGYQIDAWVKPTVPFAPVLLAAKSEIARYLKAVANNWTMPYEVVVHNVQHTIIKLDRNKTVSTGPKYTASDEINTYDHGKYHDINEVNSFMEALVHSCKRFGILCFTEPVGYTAERKLINAVRNSVPFVFIPEMLRMPILFVINQ
uniref:Carboxypeptidase activation peptide domain-containing protein n=1 Tax=Romanomermis culicivorax TaxID=13658 RepID=A0A915I7B9_ROMCU